MSNGYTWYSNLWFNMKRVWVDVLALISLLCIGFFAPHDLFPIEAKLGFISLFFSKMIFVSAGLLHSHIARQILFPYINFNNSKDPFHKAMIIALYVIVTFCWARGG